MTLSTFLTFLTFRHLRARLAKIPRSHPTPAASALGRKP